MDEAIREFEAHGVDIPFDKNHATVLKLPEGEDAPAFGWGKKLWFDAARGLMCHVQWTDEGAEEIQSGRYRYLSPLVGYDQDTGRVRQIHSVALTTKPATPRMPALAAMDLFQIRKDDEMTFKSLQQDGQQGPSATAEQKMGELKSALEKSGVELGDGADFVTILNAAIKIVEGGSPDETEDGEVAATVRQRLGLNGNASRDEVLVALSVATAGAGARRELADLRRGESERLARERVYKYVDNGVLLETDKPAMAAAMSLAAENPDRFEALMANAAPIVPQGRTTAPTQSQTQLWSVIGKARQPWDADAGNLKALTSCRAYVSNALREANLSILTDEELKDIPASE